jgi:hypothetical protein
MVLRRIFVRRRDEVTGGWRKLHNEGLHNLYCSPSIIRKVQSRRVRWIDYVARMRSKGILMGYWLETKRKYTTRKTKPWMGA